MATYAKTSLLEALDAHIEQANEIVSSQEQAALNSQTMYDDKCAARIREIFEVIS